MTNIHHILAGAVIIAFAVTTWTYPISTDYGWLLIFIGALICFVN